MFGPFNVLNGFNHLNALNDLSIQSSPNSARDLVDQLELAAHVVPRKEIPRSPQWSLENRPTDQARDQVVLPLCLLIRQVHFGSPTAWAAFENVTVMEEAVEHCGDGGAVTEQLAPVLHRTVGRQILRSNPELCISG